MSTVVTLSTVVTSTQAWPPLPLLPLLGTGLQTLTVGPPGLTREVIVSVGSSTTLIIPKEVTSLTPGQSSLSSTLLSIL
jgi:hypothetical protein